MPTTVSKKFHPYYFSFQKRSFDLILSLILLMISGPLILIISILICLTMGSPIIFQQKRWGKNKKTFTLFKFRTMKIEAEKLQKKLLHLNQAPAPMFKIFDDPRYLGIGKFLAKTGFDELPQLINIIKGEMSFVGPRPLPVKEAKKLNQKNQSWNFRWQVKPGIFSYWSLSSQRHQSLKKWQALEKMTLTEGGLIFEIKMIGQTLLKQILALFY